MYLDDFNQAQDLFLSSSKQVAALEVGTLYHTKLFDVPNIYFGFLALFTAN